MRILLVAGSYPPEECGVGDYSQQLALALDKYTDLEVGVLTGVAAGRPASGNISLLEVAPNWRLSELPQIIRAIRRWGPDLLHVQYPSQGFSGRMPSLLPLVCRLLGLKVVQTWHEPYSWREGSLFLMQLLGARGLIFVRPNYLDLMPALFRKLLRLRPQVFIPSAGALPVSSTDPNLRQRLRQHYMGDFKRLVVFFGFIYPSKGIESLFEIANPATDMLVIAGGIKDETYTRRLAELARTLGWREEQICFTGFIASHEASSLLGAADAVVLPFLDGGGEWNTSILSALAQGTLVITTAVNPGGDDPTRNLYTAAPSDISEMRAALDRLAGRRVAPSSMDTVWRDIASAHRAFYQRFRPFGTDKQA